MLFGLIGAFRLPRGYLLAYAICVVLSVLYSAPPFRLKSVPGADWLINMWGFGSLTPYAGWAATGLPLGMGNTDSACLLPAIRRPVPLTQIYQFEEDARRGDRTLALSLGRRKSLIVAQAAAVIAFVLFGLAARRAGGLRTTAGAGLCWRWRRWPGRSCWCPGSPGKPMSTRDHQRGMYQALLAWAVTDVAVALAWAA